MNELISSFEKLKAHDEDKITKAISDFDKIAKKVEGVGKNLASINIPESSKKPQTNFEFTREKVDYSSIWGKFPEKPKRDSI